MVDTAGSAVGIELLTQTWAASRASVTPVDSVKIKIKEEGLTPASWKSSVGKLSEVDT